MAESDLEITVVYAEPSQQQLIELTLPRGTTAREALVQVLQKGLINLSISDVARDPMDIALGVYAELVPDEYALQPGDRLEIYRPLVQDPMERRRKMANSI